ncbi:hypothetical protein DPMN_011848 [Dreissena polymorpha]|uniref:Uncharacterized protein n=1 Tax=Dreissena polymorpha TaxID=45954 RepID=A0A9D4N4F7_DREPO|nr:hypothetical protein DPMN_011848 [Dreissena polymorpha]
MNIRVRYSSNTVSVKVYKVLRFRFDDVTKPNQGLINRLHLHPDIESAWYFNGAVYEQTVAGERIKFDIYDNVSGVIEDFSQYRRNGTVSR